MTDEAIDTHDIPPLDDTFFTNAKMRMPGNVRRVKKSLLDVSVMHSNQTQFMQTDLFVFVEIASQHDRGGADAATILEGIDYRQKMLLTDFELLEGLKRLEEAGMVFKRSDKYLVTETVAASLPRTPSGQLSFRRVDWNKLRKKFFDT